MAKTKTNSKGNTNRRSVINQISISISISHLAKLVQLNEEIILTMEGFFLLLWLNPG